MKIKNFKKEGNLEEIESTKLSVSDILIDTKDFLEYYEKDEDKKFVEKLSSIELPDFSATYKVLRKYKNIKGISNLNDATVTNITEKRYEIRNAINTVIGTKDNFSDYKSIWNEIEYLTNTLYDRSKDRLLLNEDIKSLKNNDLRMSEVNYQLKDLVKIVDKVGLIMLRFKQVSDEIKDTLLYLQVALDEISRVQSSLSLALDTGEIERVYWKKGNEDIF
jgi:ribonucleotide reductase alpha subunit